MNYSKSLSDERVIMRMYDSHQISAKDAGGMIRGLINKNNSKGVCDVHGNSYL